MSIALPRRAGGRILLGVVVVGLLLVLVSLGSWGWLMANPVRVEDPPPGVLALLTQPIANGPDADLLRRGRYLAITGDCVSCHTRSGGQPFAGGLGMKTPFGVIYSPNLTSDRATGIGGWTPDQFYRALHAGMAPGGKRLYPALPYPHFTMIPRADTDAMLAFLKTVPAVSYTPPPNRLPFPLDIRLAMIGWNAISFRPHGFVPDPRQSAVWNRGAYLVEGPGHCGACHTPKNPIGAERGDAALQGATLDSFVAPNLTGDPRTGLGRWSDADIVEYLHTGRNAHANAAGQMAEVVTYSTSLMPPSDLQAIAAYLKSLPPVGEPVGGTPDPAAMSAGGAVFEDACTACHLEGGKGQTRMFPPLAGSAAVQQRDPSGLVRYILAGARTAPTLSRPSFQSMPSFAWKLSDQEIADVVTYIRNSGGNRAGPVSVSEVSKLRSKLGLNRPTRGAP
jgi:mono/diheme cytochrome c family protein